MLSAAIVDCLQGIVNSRPFPKITKIRGSINRELDQLGETTMDAAHIHLLLNHIPILGTIFGLLLLCYGTWRHSDEIKKVSLGTFVIVALITIVVYLTGDGAAQIVGIALGDIATTAESFRAARMRAPPSSASRGSKRAISPDRHGSIAAIKGISSCLTGTGWRIN